MCHVSVSKWKPWCLHPVKINYIVIVPLQFWLKVNQCNHYLSHATLVLAPGIKLSVDGTQPRSFHLARFFVFATTSIVQFTTQHPAHVHSMYKKTLFHIWAAETYNVHFQKCTLYVLLGGTVKTHTSKVCYCKLDVSSGVLERRLEFRQWSSSVHWNVRSSGIESQPTSQPE